MKDFEFGVYVHWPYCAAKCPYCDFNSHVRTQVQEAEWVGAIQRELAFAASEMIPAHWVVSSIFFGGGTPSLMSASTTGTVLEAIANHWSLSPAVEITLEANPSSADTKRFLGYRGAGINRMSLGVQSLDDKALKFLGRIHDSTEARRAVTMANRIFDRVSIDLIYARPDQSAAAWRAELRDALSLGTEHLSLYQLTIEDGTPFSVMRHAGTLVPLADDPAAVLYEQTQEIMDLAGLPAYEISNHARSGSECRHNLIYWQYGNYLGVGPGAHGRIAPGATTIATITERNPERWLARVAAHGHGFLSFAPITPQEASTEHLLMNLRLPAGVDRLQYHARWGRDLDEHRVHELSTAEFIEADGARVRVTPKGRLVLNAVIAALADPG